MTALGDHLWKQFGGDVPATLQGMAQAARDQYGSNRAAARGLGVDERTVRRWLSGEVQTSRQADRVAGELRSARADRHEGPINVRFKFDKRERSLNFGSGGKALKAGAEKAVREAYEKGDKEGMARAFIKGIDDSWYREQFEDAYGAVDAKGEDSDAVGAFV